MNKVTAEPSIFVGLSGGAGVGKSTIARQMWLVSKFQILSYAHPLKSALIKMTGLDRKWFYDIDYKEKEIPGLPAITPRIMMQKFGTEYAREMIAPDFWLWRMRQSISRYSDRDIVIDDIRFENESQLIRDNGGIIIHLRRDFDSPTDHTTHESEQEIIVSERDYVIYSGLQTKHETYNDVAGIVQTHYYGGSNVL